MKSKLNEITTGNPKYRLKDQLDSIKIIKNLYNSRQKVIKLYNDYAKIISEAMCKTKHRKGLKILTLEMPLINCEVNFKLWIIV